MHVQVHYQGLESTPWLEEFIRGRVRKLERFLGAAATVQVNLKIEHSKYLTSLVIHNAARDYSFSAQGETLYESFSESIDKATRALGDQKRKVKDKINKRFFSLKRELAI